MKPTQIKIKGTKPVNLLKGLSKTPYESPEEAIYELINNSIASKVNNLSIELKFIIKSELEGDKYIKVVDKVIIKDNGCGIPSHEINMALTPFAKETQNSINEHDVGLKSSVLFLGEKFEVKTKAINEEHIKLIDGYSIDEFSIGDDISLTPINFDGDHGTEVEIFVSKDKNKFFKISTHKGINQMKNILGKKYQLILTDTSIKFNLTIVDEEKIRTEIINSVKPIYYYPPEWDADKTKKIEDPIIDGKEFTCGNVKAILKFGYSPKNDIIGIKHYQMLDMDPKLLKSGSNYPYNIAAKYGGFDFFIYDILIEEHVVDFINDTGSNWTQFLRGQVRWYGVETVITKNRIIRSDDVLNILEQIKLFLKNGKISSSDNFKFYNEESAKSFKNSINKSGMNLISNPYIRQQKMSDEHQLRDTIAQSLNSFGSMYYGKTIIGSTKEEYVLSGSGNKLDIYIKEDNIPWEVKLYKAEVKDVSQLLQYMIELDSNNGYLVAEEFPNKVIDYTNKINKKFKDLNIKLNLLEYSNDINGLTLKPILQEFHCIN